MKWTNYAVAAAMTAAMVGQANSIVTSNSGGKASIEEEVAHEISVQTSAAIEGIWRAISAIENQTELRAGEESVNAAIGSLNEVLGLLDKAISQASSEALEVGDPSQIQIGGEYAEAAQPVTATEVIQFLQKRISPWPPSEKTALEFLLRETKTAVAAAEIIRVGQSEGNEDMVRLGLMTFTRFQYSATAFSVLWGLISS